MQRIAAPMVGGMITAPVLSMLVIPAIYLLMRRPRVRHQKRDASHAISPLRTAP
jgi:Cu/Ag efflux pump CusA